MNSTVDSTKVGTFGELIGSVGASVHLPGPDDYLRPSDVDTPKAAYVVNCRSVVCGMT